jgi:uncharacterized repeat protein (TIGR03833 family)
VLLRFIESVKTDTEYGYYRNRMKMNGQNRKNIKTGSEVYIVLKKDQKSGKRTKGIVKDLLTKKSFHPHGIKVRLQDGQVGRVQEVIKE